jgi:cytochrome c
VIRAATGGLLLLALIHVAFAPAAADPVRGERMFQRCFACHSVVTGEDNLPGPSLRCVLGRSAGTLPGFRFSPAMIEAGTARGLVWTRATLDAFLIDPQRLVPVTPMWIPGLASAQDRRDLIDYLEHAVSCPVEAPSPPGQP